MAENLFKTEIADIRLSVGFFDEAFCMNRKGGAKWSLASLKTIHQHSTYEIFFVVNGSLSIITERETMSCEHSVVIIPPFVNHYTVADGLEGNCVCFSVERLQKLSGKLFSAVEGVISKGVTVTPITDNERFYVERITDAIAGKQPRDNIRPLLTLLFSEIFWSIAPKESGYDEQSGKQGKYINTIDVYLSGHYCENITLSDIAKELYLCEKQVSRIIKKVYGCSLSELVNRRRLTAACMLLKYTTMPISEVASNVGYEYENYFFTLFKKSYGMTPMKYRETNV